MKNIKQTFLSYWWQPIKALLCVLQFNLLDLVCRTGMMQELYSFNVEYGLWYALLRPLNGMLIVFALWKCYDNIDDRTFLAFCREQEPPHLLRRPAWRIAVIIGAVGVAPMLGLGLWESLSYTGLPAVVGIPLCILVAAAAFVAFRVWQVNDLYDTWLIQKKLHSPDIRFPSIPHRIFDAVIMYVVSAILCSFGLLYVAIVAVGGLLSVLYLLLTEFTAASVSVIVVLVGLILACYVSLLVKRRRFMKRLIQLRDIGEISFKTEGHPYLSVFSPRIYFGLLVEDMHCIDRQGRRIEKKKYRVSVVGCQHKRYCIVLCENHVFRFRRELRLRFTPQATVMRGMGVRPAGNTAYSLMTWHTNFAMRFPDGTGFDENVGDERPHGGDQILILDPVPTKLYVARGKLTTELDNGSSVFDYTVWSKNAFVNMMDRT